MLHVTEKCCRRKIGASQRVKRKYRKEQMRRLRNKEYNRLRAILPSVARKEKVSKVTIVQEATKHIDELHKAIAEKLHSLGLRNADSPSVESMLTTYFLSFQKQMQSPPDVYQKDNIVNLISSTTNVNKKR